MADNPHPRRDAPGRLVLYWSLGIGTMIVGSLLSAALYMKYQGASLIEFCSESLLDESSVQVVALAREIGFETLEGHDKILLTMPGRHHGRTCFLSISDGSVTNVSSAFTF
jgi:hypothetical protein